MLFIVLFPFLLDTSVAGDMKGFSKDQRGFKNILVTSMTARISVKRMS